MLISCGACPLRSQGRGCDARVCEARDALHRCAVMAYVVPRVLCFKCSVLSAENEPEGHSGSAENLARGTLEHVRAGVACAVAVPVWCVLW
jgi:hypothetical protein